MSEKYISKQLYSKLRQLISSPVYDDDLSLAMYSSDASIYQIRPACVVCPKNTADIVRVVRFAAHKGMPIHVRGAASGLAGESLGRGIVLDMSRFMNHIIDIDTEGATVTVEPGVVLDVLNRELAKTGRQIGPDPASGSRATIGGMIGNNATGAHSIQYGYISRYIKSLEVVSATGQVVQLNSPKNNQGSNLANNWARQIKQLIDNNRELINQHQPQSQRNGCGYNIFEFAESPNENLNNNTSDNNIANDTGVNIDLTRLIAGSEGTLAIVTRVVLQTVDIPRVKTLLQANFASLTAMARAVPHIIKYRPAACELMDGKLLKLARDAYWEYHDVLPDVAASLLIEFDGDNKQETLDRLREAGKMLQNLPAEYCSISSEEIIDINHQQRVWTARKAATPLLYRNKGALQPVPVIEDVAVPVERLAEYVKGLSKISNRLDIGIIYYAHAGDGELHPRPFFNLHRKQDVEKMQQLADEVFKLAWSLGGTISGEHGEGLVRVSYIKQQYGDEIYELFRKVKHIFDPAGMLNPGKIINDDPNVMIRNLRYNNKYVRNKYKSSLIFKNGEFITEIEQCNGNGLCRSTNPNLTMCPIFRALGTEEASPRAKANLMRNWYYGLLDSNVLQSREFKRIADLCINCKMCAMECPSLVNIPKLMSEARANYVKHHGLTRAQYALTRNEFMSRWGSRFAPVANIFLANKVGRWLLEKTLGLDKRRMMPHFDWGGNIARLRKYIQDNPCSNNGNSNQNNNGNDNNNTNNSVSDNGSSGNRNNSKVAYFVDSYAAYNDYQLGQAVIDILQYNNIEVIIPPQLTASMPAISYGDTKYARKVVRYNTQQLAKAVRAGYTIVCSEPTAALCLQQEYLDITDSPDAQLVAQNTIELTAYLLELHHTGRLRKDFGNNLPPLLLAYHSPCHYKALQIGNAGLELLKLINGIDIELLPDTCCGIAGTFGFQKKNYELSMLAGKPMLEALNNSKANFGLTECSTCKMQMEHASNKKVLHPVKVLAWAYGLLDKL